MRNSLSSIGEKDILRQSEPVSKIPKKKSESPPKAVLKSIKPSNTNKTLEHVSKSDENLLSTVKLRRNANEYLKVNQNVSKSTTVRATSRPPSDEISKSQKERPGLIDCILPGSADLSSETKSTDSLDSQPKTFIVSSSSDLPPTTESTHPQTLPSLTPENEINQHLQTETTTVHAQNKQVPLKPRDDLELTSPSENNNNAHPTIHQDNQHTTGTNNHHKPEPSFINNDNVNQSLSIDDVELSQPILPEYENVKLFHLSNTSESSAKKLDSAPPDEAENSSTESEVLKNDSLIKSELITNRGAQSVLSESHDTNIVNDKETTTLIHSEPGEKKDVLNASEKKQINKCEEKCSPNSKLEPIYESLGKTAFNLKTPSSRSPNIPGSGPNSPQPVIQTTHGKYGGSIAASGRETRTVRKYWDEDSLCLPLTRQQRAAANPGLSLPASSPLSDTQAINNQHFRADKSFSLGDYYKSEPVAQKSKFNLKTSGLKFLQRLNSLRQSFKSKQEIKVFPVPDSSDSDRVFFRGFSGVYKDDYEAARRRPGSQLITGSQFHQPTAPPRKKRPKTKLTRSLSLTDAEFITQAVAGGEADKIEEIYPDFPRSTPIYAVIDRSKKKGKNRCEKSEDDTALRQIRRSKHEGQLESQDNKCDELHTKDDDLVAKVAQSKLVGEENDNHSQSDTTLATLATLVTGSSSTLNTEEDAGNMVKSYSASNSPITNNEFDVNNSKSKHKKKKHKKKKEVDNETLVDVDDISNTNFHSTSDFNQTQNLTGKKTDCTTSLTGYSNTQIQNTFD